MKKKRRFGVTVKIVFKYLGKLSYKKSRLNPPTKKNFNFKLKLEFVYKNHKKVFLGSIKTNLFLLELFKTGIGCLPLPGGLVAAFE